MKTDSPETKNPSILEILTYPDPVLKKRAVPVGEITDDIRLLAGRMIKTMMAAPGVGLAAPQVGESIRLVIVDMSCGDDREPSPEVMINPEITKTSGEELDEEGCLSLPGLYADAIRPEKLKAVYTNIDGERVEVEAEGMLARCIAHEVDHLDGVLFWDRLGKFKRDWLKLKFKRMRTS